MDMPFGSPPDTPRDALLYLDFVTRFGGGDDTILANMHGIARVLRDLMDRVQVQSATIERLEANACKETK